MIRLRRFHLQLTPLLDLLLIVIFAQYLEVQEQATRQRVATEKQLESGQRELAAAKTRQSAAIRAARAELQATRRELDDKKTALDDRERELDRRIEEVVDRQRRAANLIGELFDVPMALIEQALKPPPPGAPPRSEADIERLRARFEELAELRGAEVVKHLLSYDELRKRADVWTLRIAATGLITLSADGESLSFRAAGSEDFAREMYQQYKTLPEPKGLVVILVSYGDARADVRQDVLEGLPQAIRLMREDRLGQTQFEYAVLGYMPRE